MFHGKICTSDNSQAETFIGKDWFTANTSGHGGEGPLVTTVHEPAPISKLVLQLFEAKGLPLKDDMFTSEEYSNGCGHAIRSVYEGIRTCSTAYLKEDGVKPRVTLETGQYVDRLIVEMAGEGQALKATAVHTVDAKSNILVYRAHKEIILAAGTYGSPAILLRSGIGPASELDALDIPAIIDLPGIGKNVMDHLVRVISHPSVTYRLTTARSCSVSTKSRSLVSQMTTSFGTREDERKQRNNTRLLVQDFSLSSHSDRLPSPGWTNVSTTMTCGRPRRKSMVVIP
jgi:choline dehydrogenase-like flavoprotein